MVLGLHVARITYYYEVDQNDDISHISVLVCYIILQFTTIRYV